MRDRCLHYATTLLYATPRHTKLHQSIPNKCVHNCATGANIHAECCTASSVYWAESVQPKNNKPKPGLRQDTETGSRGWGAGEGKLEASTPNSALPFDMFIVCPRTSLRRSSNSARRLVRSKVASQNVRGFPSTTSITNQPAPSCLGGVS
jgi:hypothetical protein